jgi:hypothetical protein
MRRAAEVDGDIESRTYVHMQILVSLFFTLRVHDSVIFIQRLIHSDASTSVDGRRMSTSAEHSIDHEIVVTHNKVDA